MWIKSVSGSLVNLDHVEGIAMSETRMKEWQLVAYTARDGEYVLAIGSKIDVIGVYERVSTVLSVDETSTNI